MNKIINKEQLAKDVVKIILEAPQIAKKAKAGQFVVIIPDEHGERIPLTLADWDKDKGIISLIFQKVGYTTKKLGTLNIGDNIQHILGPLGHPTEIKKIGTVICIGGGVGIAEVYPVTRAFKETGNLVIGIIGARSKDLLILEEQMRKVCDELFITTDNGSYGQKGFVTDVLKRLLSSKLPACPAGRQTPCLSGRQANSKLIYAIGPVPMMKAVSELTRPYKLKTIVSLNPVMVDATGMCGSCRCTVAGRTVFGCVDGPDFDAHQVDFDELQKRLKLFEKEEKNIDER